MFRLRHLSLCLLSVITSLQAASPKIWNVPQSAENIHVRSHASAMIEKALSSPSAQVAITGHSGVGKTELVKNLINNVHERYQTVWWFDAARDLDAQFIQFAQAWNQNSRDENQKVPLEKMAASAVTKTMLSRLHQDNNGWLLVFDNAGSFTDVKSYLPAAHKSAKTFKHVIITSQNNNDWRESYQLGQFSKNDATKFIQSSIGQKNEIGVDKILKTVGHSPFLLGQAVSYMKNNNLSISDFVNQKKSMPEFNQNNAIKDKIEALRNTNKAAFDVLSLISLTNKAVFSHSILQKYLNVAHPAVNLLDVVNELNRFSLIQDAGTTLTARTYTAHDIIKSTTRRIATDGLKKSQVTAMATILVSKLDLFWDDMMRLTASHPDLVPQAFAIRALAEEFKSETEDVFKLGVLLMEYESCKSINHDNYEKLFHDNVRMIKNNHSISKNQDLVDHFYLVSIFVRDIYNHDDMKPKIESGLKRLVKHLDSEKVDLGVEALYSLAQFYLHTGQTSKALQTLDQGIPYLDKSKSTSNISAYWYMRASIYRTAGQVKEVEASLDKFFASAKSDITYALELFGLNMKARLLLDKEHFDEAIIMAQKNIDAAKIHYQSGVSDISAGSLVVMGTSYFKKGDLINASVSLNKAIDTYNQYFGRSDTHADQAKTLLVLGQVKVEQGLYDEAMKNYHQARKVYAKLYKDNIKDNESVSKVYVALAKLGVKAKNDQIYQTYLDLQIKHFGEQHAGTREILSGRAKA